MNVEQIGKMFQFHKVRLKESPPQWQAFDLTLFQFHKVRLKVKAGKSCAILSRSFNSTRYD